MNRAPKGNMMHRFLTLNVFLLLIVACGSGGTGDKDSGIGEEPSSPDAPAEDEGPPLDPDTRPRWPIVTEISTVPTPTHPMSGAIMRNVITHQDVPDDALDSGDGCFEPAGLMVNFVWDGVHGNAIATTFGIHPTFTSTVPTNPFDVKHYDLCVTKDKNATTKCTGGPKDEIYRIDPPTSTFAPPDGLPREKFYLKDFTWQVRGCGGSTGSLCGAWSTAMDMSWGLAPPVALREEVITLADGSPGLKLHFCNVNKEFAAQDGTSHLICLMKAADASADAAAECQEQYETRTARGNTYWIVTSSNSPEPINDRNALPAPDDDGAWTVGACNVVDLKYCAWDLRQPRIFSSPF